MSDPNISLDDVLDAMMLEESDPSYAALVRWTERYPQYREDLADFFATWAMQAEETEDVEIDEERLVQLGVQYALHLLRPPVADVEHKPVSLGPFDELVLAAMFIVRGEISGRELLDKISEMSGKQPLYGTLFSALTGLERQGLVVVRQVDAPDRPKGVGKRLFRITRAGEQALAAARETSKAINGLLEDFA